MKILYVHQYFCTPDEPGGTRSYWFARELVGRGHHVVMITSTNAAHPNAGRVNIDGIDVVYVKNEYSNYFSPLRKVWSFVKFMGASIRQAGKENNMEKLDKLKADALTTFKIAKKEYLQNQTPENWKRFCDAKINCKRLGVII